MTFGGIGVCAIFLADNEAGSAVALLLCGALTLIAIQGSKVQRISAGENSVDFVARFRAKVARAAEDRAQDNPEVAEALIESYQAADPQAQADPSFVQARASIYERHALTAVALAMQKLAPQAHAELALTDSAYRVGGLLLAIDVKYRQPHRKLYLEDARQIKALLNEAEADVMLVISNVMPTARFAAEVPSTVRVAVWDPESSPELIESALAELLTEIGNQG